MFSISDITGTGMPPYPLIQYMQLQLSMVHHALKKNWKIKEMSVS
jgi:hypothetical protein